MCVPIVIDTSGISQVDPNDPTKRLNADGSPAQRETSGNDSNLGRGAPGTTPAGVSATPAGGSATPATPSDPGGDFWGGVNPYSTNGTVGDPTGGVPAAGTTPNGTDGSTPTGPDTNGPKPAPAVDPSVTAAGSGNSDLMTAINNQAVGFKQVADSILAGQQAAADALRSGFLDLTKQQQDALKASDDLRKNSGQAERTPNYSLTLKRNAARNRAGGSASTLLSGVGGINTNTLSLGKTSALGGVA